MFVSFVMLKLIDGQVSVAKIFTSSLNNLFALTYSELFFIKLRLNIYIKV